MELIHTAYMQCVLIFGKFLPKFYYIKNFYLEVRFMSNSKPQSSINFIADILEKLKNENFNIDDIISNKKGFSTIVELILNSIMSAQRDDFLL